MGLIEKGLEEKTLLIEEGRGLLYSFKEKQPEMENGSIENAKQALKNDRTTLSKYHLNDLPIDKKT